MKKIIFLLMLIFCAPSYAEEIPLFHANSKELGYDSIDIDITEISRGERTSVLKIRGFHNRSAFGSRWLMCAYTNLAMKRNFKNWIAYYPTQPDEDLFLIFPDNETDDLSKLVDQELDKSRLVPSPPFNKMLAFVVRCLKNNAL